MPCEKIQVKLEDINVRNIEHKQNYRILLCEVSRMAK